MNPPAIPALDPRDIEAFTRDGYWRTETLGDVIHRHAESNPNGIAYIEGEERLTWAQYDRRSSEIAGLLIDAGLQPGEFVGVMLPDAPLVHIAFQAAEKAGLTVVGIGPRSGEREIGHLLSKAHATALVTEEIHRGQSMAELVQRLRAEGIDIRKHIVVDRHTGRAVDAQLEEQIRRRKMGPNELWLLNSTSGTTGLPKQVMQFQNRWFAFHQLAEKAGPLTAEDVYMSIIPAPFGFGLWTAHFTPAILGAPTVLMSRYNTEGALDLIERERVSVLMCVSTQFIMMLNSPSLGSRDLSSLKCMFTGGEAIPYERAAEFEERTGAKVLQFYGSNETGALSYTTHRDSREIRLKTSGKVIDFMDVRLYDDDGRDITATKQPGQPACRGPLTCIGYYDDAKANAELFTPDGWMLTGDIATIDDEGCIHLVGRKSDFIIRGGKNVSAPAVEDEVGSHPAVAMVACVSMPDPVFGERVCAYIVPREGQRLALEELAAYLEGRGVSKEWFPERLVFVESLPTASGGKVAKAELRADIRRRLQEEGSR